MLLTDQRQGGGRDGPLKLKPFKQSITCRDPCQISRRGDATVDPRFLLDDFATDFREMSLTGNYSRCCGGVQVIERAADVRHGVFRINLAQVGQAGAGAMIMACWNCRLTMDESKAVLGWDKELMSLVEILADHPEPGKAQA